MAGGYQAYPEYKDSGVEWFHEVPINWAQSRLKFLSLINMGQSPSSEDCNQHGLGIPFLQGNAEFGDIYPKAINYCQKPRKTSDQGDLLFSVRAPVGALNRSDKKYGIGRGLCAIKPLEKISRQFLWWLIPVLKNELITVSTGSTFDAVSVEQVSNVRIFWPDLISEQLQIATFLNHETAKIDTLIEKQQRLISLLKEKRQAVISHAVTKGLNPDAPMKDSGVEWLGQVPAHWGVIKGGYIGQLFGSDAVSESHITEEGTYQFLKVSDLDTDGFDISSKHWFISEDVSSFYQYKKDYIVFPKRGAAIFTNKVNIVREYSVVDPNLMGWKINSNFIIEFVAYVLKCRGLTDIADVSTVPQINNKHIAPEKFPTPPKHEQQQIVEFLYSETAKIDTLIEKTQYSIELSKERRTALISAAVTGKIDVRNWQPPSNDGNTQ
jgi:type I restriction enzyme, S subunit